jgi:hypothetical protein
MSGAVCAACMAPLLSVIGICLDCDPRNVLAEPHTPRRYRVLPGGDRARLLRGLSALAPEAPPDLLKWVVERGHFDLVGEWTSAQEATLFALGRACAAPLTPLTGPSASPQALRFAWDGRIPAKMGATIAVGGATLWLGVPLVPLASCLMLGLLAARAARWEPREVTVAPSRVEALLGPVDGSFIADLRATRTRMIEPEVIETVRALAGHVAELGERLREGAAHLLVPAASKVDAALSDLGRSALRLALAANRAGPQSDPPEDPSGRRYSRSTRRFEDATRRLRELEAELRETRDRVVASPPGDLQSGVLDVALRTLLKLKGDCTAAFGELAA